MPPAAGHQDAGTLIKPAPSAAEPANALAASLGEVDGLADRGLGRWREPAAPIDPQDAPPLPDLLEVKAFVVEQSRCYAYLTSGARPLKYDPEN
jgi:hypothetical protein